MAAKLKAGEKRLRKAWLYRFSWSDFGLYDTVYAPSAGAARNRVRIDCADSYSDITFSDIVIRRNRDGDMLLPAEHRLVADLSENDRNIVLHAYGYQGHSPHKAGYRGHYCTCPGDTRLLRLSWELGLFDGPNGAEGENGPWGENVFFHLSDLGRQVAASMVPAY